MKTRSQTNSLPKPVEKYVDLPVPPKPSSNPKKPDQTTDEIYSEIADELYKPARRRYPTRKVVTMYPNDVWGVDLADLNDVIEFNNEFRYIVVCVDCFSRFAWGVPLKNKTGTDTLDALKEIVKQNNNVYPGHLWVDQGSEFYNSNVKDWCKEHNITMYSVYGHAKSAMVERFNRTLKTNLYKQFYANRSKEWVKILPDVINTYNNTEHSSIKMTPKKAHNLKDDEIKYLYNYQNKRNPKQNDHPAKFKVGDYVRVNRKKGTFEKGYEQGWTTEIFKIFKSLDTIPWTYNIEDLKGRKYDGGFYEQELQLTQQKPGKAFTIEEELETRGTGADQEVLVKWQGYGKEYNSWVKASTIKK